MKQGEAGVGNTSLELGEWQWPFPQSSYASTSTKMAVMLPSLAGLSEHLPSMMIPPLGRAGFQLQRYPVQLGEAHLLFPWCPEHCLGRWWSQGMVSCYQGLFSPRSPPAPLWHAQEGSAGWAVRGELVQCNRSYLAFLYPVLSSVEVNKSHQLHCSD